MKINRVKLLLAICLAAVLGFVCEIIAPEVGGRNWISFAVSFISIASGLIPSMGLVYTNERRGVSIRVLAWIITSVLVISNVIFSSFEYKIDIYIAINLLIAVIGWVSIYGVLSAKEAKQ